MNVKFDPVLGMLREDDAGGSGGTSGTVFEFIPSDGSSNDVGNYRLRLFEGVLLTEKCETTPNNWVIKDELQ